MSMASSFSLDIKYLIYFKLIMKNKFILQKNIKQKNKSVKTAQRDKFHNQRQGN